MTQHEKLICTAYTGVLFTTWSEFHKYAEELLGKPICTTEFVTEKITKELKEKSTNDFFEIITSCELLGNTGSTGNKYFFNNNLKFCPRCGSEIRRKVKK